MDFWRSIHKALRKEWSSWPPADARHANVSAHTQLNIYMHTPQLYTLYTLLALRFGQPEATGSHGLKPDKAPGLPSSGP